MNPLIPGTIAVIVYLVGAGLQWRTLSQDSADARPLVLACACIAVLCHTLTLYSELFAGNGVNLGIFPMLSVMAVAITALVLINSFRRPVENLFIAIFPIAAVSLILEQSATRSYAPRTDLNHGILAHVVLSVIAYSLLTIAALQAALLSFGDYELRQHNLTLLRRLPPLQTMEALLFETLWAGLIFLTLSIASGFTFLRDFGGPGLVHHTVITLAAWAVFAILLWGRYQRGWRGPTASRWALSGFVILVIGYFGSKLVLEVILSPV